MADVFVGHLINDDGTRDDAGAVYLWGVVREDGTVEPMVDVNVPAADAGTAEPPPPSDSGVTYGTFARPFAGPEVSPWNTPVSAAATYESPTAPTTKLMRDNVAKGTVNDEASGYSVAIDDVAATVSTTDAPVVTVRHPNDGSAKAGTVYVPATSGFRIRKTFKTPMPPGGEMGDRNSSVFNGGRHGFDFYRLVKVSDTEWTSTSVDAIDLQSTGIVRGVRAANVALIAGLIRKHEVDAVLAGTATDFGHALAISAPETMLGPPKPDPGFQWPANQRDSDWITYSGLIRLGMLFAIPPGSKPTAAGLLAQALVNTLVRFGVYVVDRSSTVALYLEHGVPSSSKDVLRTAWRDLGIPNLRLITSNTASTPGGGGSPRL